MLSQLAVRWRRLSLIVGVNLLVFLALFIFVEVAYRLYKDGFPGAFVHLVSASQVPYSDLGTGNWVVSDDLLGFRLNPENPSVNSFSLLGDEIVVPKPEGLYRILFLGDSVAYDDFSFVYMIRETLQEGDNIEVINASVPGYTTYQQLMWLKHDLLPLSSDLVILAYVLNDNHQFLHRFDADARMLLTKEAENSIKVNSWFDHIISRSYLLVDLKFRVIRNIQDWANRDDSSETFPWDQRADVNVAWKDQTWGAFEEHLVEMKNLIERNGGKLAVVVFPFEPQLDQEYLSLDRKYVLTPQSKVSDLCIKHQISCLDLFPPFLETTRALDTRLFRDNIHLNQQGHELAHREISEFLAGEGLRLHQQEP